MAYHTEKTQSGTDIVVDGWQSAISHDPYQGLADMRNIDNVSIMGEASVALSTQAMITQAPITNVTTTVYNILTYTFQYNGTVPLEVNTAITFANTGGALPTGLSANTAYYIKTIDNVNHLFTVSNNAGGSVTTFSDVGSGTTTFSTIQMGTPTYTTTATLQGGYLGALFYFILDSNGRCWVLDNYNLGRTNKWVYMHNQFTEQAGFLQSGNGLIAYQGYLFWFSASDLNVISLLDFSQPAPQVTLAFLTTKGNWFSSWKIVLTSTYTTVSHYAIIGVNDNAMYFCNGGYVGSLYTAIQINSVPPTSSYGQIFNIANTHTIATGTTTSTSKTITTATAFFQNTDVGAVITDSSGFIPAGAYITAVASSTSATISVAATGSISGSDTFTITSGYVFNAQALALPSFDNANCLAELGTELLVGGVKSYIYPWDRISTGYDTVIFLSESYVSRMITVNTTTYIFCGFRGRVYMTNGANVNFYYEVPDFLSGTTNPYYFWTDAIFNRNQLYFGFKVTTNSGTTINQYGGMWALNLGMMLLTGITASMAKLQNQLSYGTYNGYASTFLLNQGPQFTTEPSGDGYGLFIGWNDGSVGGVDVGISTPYTNGEAYVVSDLIPIGTFLLPKTLNSVEYKLSAPLVAGESVSLYYRTNFTDSFTALPINEGNNTGDVSGLAFNNFQNTQWLQIKAVLTSTATSPSFVRLKEIRVR